LPGVVIGAFAMPAAGGLPYAAAGTDADVFARADTIGLLMRAPTPT
jgi:hypothetical protein